MTTKEARKVLGEMSVSLSDEQVEEMVALYRAIARMFINKYQEEKIAKSQD